MIEDEMIEDEIKEYISQNITIIGDKIKEYINKNTTIIHAINALKFVDNWNSKEDTNILCNLVYKDDTDEEIPVDLIKLKFCYWDKDGENEELSEQCTKALGNLENWYFGVIPSLENLRLGNVDININTCGDLTTMTITLNMYEVSVEFEPDYLLEEAIDKKYVVIGRRMNNLTNARLFKKAVEMWAK